MTVIVSPLARDLAGRTLAEPHLFLPGLSRAFQQTTVRELDARQRLQTAFERREMDLRTIPGTHDHYTTCMGSPIHNSDLEQS
jgi:hypothetical protein